ncbi:winged helix-turn-helix domain-containing protein [Alphaproteobacteria bacterium]|nr:winged helix-turn-helix domain-containing protein [Alphaproteobacteria bacterium]
MKINFSVNNSVNKDKLIIFIEKNCNFNFIEMDKAHKFNDLKLIVLKKDILQNELNKILQNPNNQNSQIFAHKSLQNKIPSNYNVIFYPTKISTFQKIVQKYQETNIFYKNIYLSQDSFLINSNNKKKIYVTEKEFEIIKVFFKNKIIKKDYIQEQILNLQKTVDTKSLDSHLTRIRNKFLTIDSGINISSVKNDSLEIKKLI